MRRAQQLVLALRALAAVLVLVLLLVEERAERVGDAGGEVVDPIIGRSPLLLLLRGQLLFAHGDHVAPPAPVRHSICSPPDATQ
jgi:hypothetical protein